MKQDFNEWMVEQSLRSEADDIQFDAFGEDFGGDNLLPTR